MEKISKKKKYKFSFVELVGYTLLFSSLMVLLGFIYFKNIIAVFVLLPVVYFFLEDERENCARKKKAETVRQFRDFIQSMNASLKSSSKTLLNCFDDAVKTMNDIYSSRSTFMKELNKMHKNLHQNKSVRFDEAFVSMARALEDDDITAFTMALKECYGVNTTGISFIIDRYANLIEEKRRISEEITTMIRSQRVEQIIMLAVPALFMVFFNSSMPSYTACLYNNSKTLVIMIIVCALNISAYFIGNRFTRIY